MNITGHILQISASEGGVPKRAIPEADIDANGLTVDHQSDRKAHGGPQRALCLYAAECIATLAGEGHNIRPGFLGENITTEGIDWSRMVPGVRVEIGGEVVAEVTDYASPCWKNARWFVDGDFTRIHQELYPGMSRVYARILEPGHIATGDEVRVIVESAAERVRRRQPVTFRWSPPA